jgi:hypothetical protein
MKLIAALLLVAATAPSPEIRYFRSQRAVVNPSQGAGQTCMVLDPAIYAHAAPQLKDLRLYQSGTETPYVIETAPQDTASPQRIVPLNPGRRDGQTVFDAAMPQGSYSDLRLSVTGHNFIATVIVSGSQAQGAATTKIGSYTIFDLAGQKLGRSTVLHLPQTDFRFLHFSIAGLLEPESISGLTVERLAESKPRYVTVAESSQVVREGRDSKIEFTVPANTPVDRVVFVPGAEPAAFSRDVNVKVAPVTQPKAGEAAEQPQAISSGSLLRLHRMQDGHRIDEERLSVDAVWTNSGTPEKWTVTTENGDDAPIQLESVRLEMLERNLCFEAAAGASYLLYYGDAALAAPQYDYATLFARQANAAKAIAGAEQVNSAYQPRPDNRPFTEEHPGLLWAALGVVVVLLGAVALRSVKLTSQMPQ